MDTNEILKTIGVELAEGETLTPEVLQSKLGERFVDLDTHKKELDATFGKARGTFETKLKGLLGDEAKGLDGEAMVGKLATRLQDMAAQLDAAKGNKSAEEIAKLQKKADDLAALLDQANTKATQAEEAARTAREEAMAELAREKTAAKISEVYNGQQWSDTANEWARRGLYAEIAAKYDFKDEGGKLMAYTKAGEIVKIGTSHATADALFQQEIKAAKLWKEVKAGDPVKKVAIDPMDKFASAKERAAEHAAKLVAAATKK